MKHGNAGTIALIGDYSPEVTAHRAIPVALDLASRSLGHEVAWEWIATSDIRDAKVDLAHFAAIWVVPASPYRNMAGALDAIRFARETRRPFLGTCGGFQHALIEIARDLAGVETADHGETNPGGETLIVTALSCSLVEQQGPVRFLPDSLIRSAYGRDSADEGYRCRYGLNAAYRATLERTRLRFTAFDDAGEIRGAEFPLDIHPFFVGTLFQPERAALGGEVPPLIARFVSSIGCQSPR